MEVKLLKVVLYTRKFSGLLSEKRKNSGTNNAGTIL